MSHRDLLIEAYERAHRHFGDQHWWPGETPFEVMVGAILAQNTNWGNVAKAIANLQRAGVLHPRRLYDLPPPQLAALIRPAGYFNIKTQRLCHFLHYFLTQYDGDVSRMAARPLAALREELLAVKGIGPETADSILLYALEKPSFVVDAYTHRILHRHDLTSDTSTYEELQATFMEALPVDAKLYNDYHAQLVAIGKQFCRPRDPRCRECPLNGWHWDHPR